MIQSGETLVIDQQTYCTGIILAVNTRAYRITSITKRNRSNRCSGSIGNLLHFIRNYKTSTYKN